MDEKIKKLDEELAQHKAAINRARPGPAQARGGVTLAGHLRAGRASRPAPRADVARRTPAQEAAKQRALRVLRQKKMCGALRRAARPV